jgi:hypothetical protein
MMDVRRFVDDAAQCADDDDGDRSGDDGGYDTSDSFINDSVDSAQEDDFDVEMTGDALGRRHSETASRDGVSNRNDVGNSRLGQRRQRPRPRPRPRPQRHRQPF